MSTDLATLLGKKKQRDDDDLEKDDDADAEEEKPKSKRKNRKTKEEKDAEEAQQQILFEEKYKCDYETYIIERVDTKPSRMNPEKNVIVIKWLNDKCPPSEYLAKMGQATQRLAIASRGVQGEHGWLAEQKKRCMTSSIIARVACVSEPHVSANIRVMQSQQVLLEQAKLLPKFEGNELTEHGKNMEPFARKVYMQERAKQPVIQIGFIQHPTNPLCGASPDGVTLDGTRLVELKCPKQRYFQEGNSTPLGYWHQIRFQIEVCAAATACSQYPNGMITHCDYFECRHMKRPRGLRTNCVHIMRDKYWFESVEPMIAQYDVHLRRLRKLRSLFPNHIFEESHAQQTAARFQVNNTMPIMFKAVKLEE